MGSIKEGIETQTGSSEKNSREYARNNSAYKLASLQQDCAR